jgi:hypothetical protein
MFVEGDPSTPPLFVRPNTDWYQFLVLGSRRLVLLACGDARIMLIYWAIGG